MWRKIIIGLIVFIILSGGIITYLNKVVLPVKVKALAIKAIEDFTQKKVSLGSVSISIFKGLVLRDLLIYDDNKTILSLKESSCAFILPVIFKKEIIIPAITLRSAVLSCERRSDNSFDIADLFINKKPAAPAKSSYRFLIRKINILNAKINFLDSTFKPALAKEINNLNFIIYLSLPAKIQFKFKSEIPGHSTVKLSAQGQYNLLDKTLSVKAAAGGVFPQDFANYYQDSGIVLPQGNIDTTASLSLKDNLLKIEAIMQNRGMEISKNEIKAKLDADIKTNLEYSFLNQQFNFSGSASINNCAILNVPAIDNIDGINGVIKFNNSGLSSDLLNAKIFNQPIELKLKFDDFKNPLINADISSSLSLGIIPQILKDRFQINLPLKLSGEGKLLILFQTKFPVSGLPLVSGTLDITDGVARIEKLDSPFDNINGRLNFGLNQLSWANLGFRYSGADYKSSGTLTNFKSPGVQLNLTSKDLTLDSLFAFDSKLIQLSKIKGKYFNSNFLISGQINTMDLAGPSVDLDLGLDLELSDLAKVFKKFQNQLAKINPQGVIHADGNIKGNILDLKSCNITAKFTSSSLFAYGLKLQDSFMNFNQENGIADIESLHLNFYDGTIDAAGKMNQTSEKFPYWFNCDIQGVQIEKLKMDTVLKDKNISGAIQAQAKINGFSNDLSLLSGAGRIIITEGNLWELNLFKGMGSLLFTSDFTRITFSEGSCGFEIKDKYFSTDSLKLKSNLVDITGLAKIGFDGSIDATLNAAVADVVPLGGSFKDITTAILGQAGKFGVIKITGTLSEPKHKFQPAVADIIKGITDIFFKKKE